MSGTIPTPITDKNGKDTTVHRRGHKVSATNSARINKVMTPERVARRDTGLPSPLVPAPIGAIGISQDEVGIIFWTIKDPSMQYTGGELISSMPFETGDPKKIAKELGERISEDAKEIVSGKLDPEIAAIRAEDIARYTAIKYQIENPEEVAKLRKWADTTRELQGSIAKLDLVAGSWSGLTSSQIHSIRRYGDYVRETRPDLNEYGVDVTLTEYLSEHEPYIVDILPHEEGFEDYVRDIGYIYAEITREYEKAGL